MSNQRIHLSIAFSNTILPVINCPDGQARVPLKPISDEIGLDWKTQKRKLLNNQYHIQRFGLILGEESLPQIQKMRLGNDQYLIKINRVTAFLNILNPQSISGQGNHESAEWLKQKHSEWDDALHAYETDGIAVKPSNGKDIINIIAKIDSIKNPELKRIASECANRDLGIDIPLAQQQTITI